MRILIDPSIVRGLDYYTGPYSSSAHFREGEAGESVFGSVERRTHDDLIARFTGKPFRRRAVRSA
jgi:histidyl-tRNA synthetase